MENRNFDLFYLPSTVIILGVPNDDSYSGLEGVGYVLIQKKML